MEKLIKLQFNNVRLFIVVFIFLLGNACAPEQPPKTSNNSSNTLNIVNKKASEEKKDNNLVDTLSTEKTVAQIAEEKLRKNANLKQTSIISAANPLAAEAGSKILKAGGSAVDAAIAAQMVLNLVEPQSSGIGGGGFLLHFNFEQQKITTYDGRETAPSSITSDIFLNSNGSPKAFHEAAVSGLSVGVPGLLRMLELAHNDHGKLPWNLLFQPAINLSQKGFKVSARLAMSVKKDNYLGLMTKSSSYFLPNDKPITTRHILKNQRLADVLQTVAEDGANGFYKGKVAQAISNTVKNANTIPGEMPLSDIANYKAKLRDPICNPYRSWLICGMAPPTSGGVTIAQILGILQNFDLPSMEPFSVEAIHLISEASRLAFADRATYIADPDFIKIPILKLVDQAYLKERSKAISKIKTMGRVKPGLKTANAAPPFPPGINQEGTSTTHMSIIDANGNVVSMTSSIESRFGSRLMTNGFLLNNQLTDFSFAPLVNGKVIANRAEPLKRPRSSMSPTLVFGPNGKFILAIGSPGGSRIISYVTKTLIAVLDWKMSLESAINSPNFANVNGQTDLEKGTALELIKPALESMGHNIRIRPMTSGLHGIKRTKSSFVGAADKRREGVVKYIRN